MGENRHLVVRSTGNFDNFPPVGIGNVSRDERQAQSSEHACDRDAIGAVFELIDGQTHNGKGYTSRLRDENFRADMPKREYRALSSKSNPSCRVIVPSKSELVV